MTVYTTREAGSANQRRANIGMNPSNDNALTGPAQPVTPPQPENTPTQGESGIFHGTNPWSGPYFVAAVIGVVIVGIIAIFVAFLIGLAGSH